MKKLIFRILGALASALIVVSVFIPFVSVTGFSQSLWQAHEATGTLYLPIMIIVFGAIGVIFFSINIKTELAYTSSGALLFFLIMQTIPIIDQGTFDSLSVGYYSLAIGTVLTGIMAFLCNLKTKQKVIESPKEETKEVSVISQIDRLYDNQVEVDVGNQNELNNIIQPLQVQPNLSEKINTMPIENNITNSIEVQTDVPTVVQNNEMSEPVVVNDVNVVEDAVSLQDLNEIKIVEPTVEPVSVSQSTTIENMNPSVSKFALPTQNISEDSNPIVSEFSSLPKVEDITQSVDQNIPSQPNPVIAEFNNFDTDMPAIMNEPIQFSEQVQPEQSTIEPIQHLNNDVTKVDIMAEPTNNTSNDLDIFG